MLNWVLVGLTVLMIHALAVGAYLTIYKLNAKKPTSVAVGTIALGGIYSITLTVAVIMVVFIHP